MDAIIIILQGIVLFVVLWVIKPMFHAYGHEKGRLLAIKEDIESLTRTVESIRLEYSTKLEGISYTNTTLLERLKGHQNLRTAALEERLALYQQAYSLWRKLFFSIHGPEDKLEKNVLECQDWWEKHCLYLGAESRKLFWQATWLALDYKDLSIKREPELKNKSWDLIQKAGEALLIEADLPTFKEEFERPSLGKRNNEKA